MTDLRAINSYLQKQLIKRKRHGASVVEAAEWLADEGLLDKKKKPEKRLRELLREGKIRGGYQFPNKRWVIVNPSRVPDLQRVVPMKEASKVLKTSATTLTKFVADGKLKPLDFGHAPFVFNEDELRRFNDKHLDRSYKLDFPAEIRKKQTNVDLIKRQLYYLRSDLRTMGERIDELIRLLEK